MQTNGLLSQLLFSLSAQSYAQTDVVFFLSQVKVWKLKNFKLKKLSSSVLLEWSEQIIQLLEDSYMMGNSIGEILEHCAFSVRSEEKRLRKLSGILSQYYLQTSIVFILPWFVCFSQNFFQWNYWLTGAIAFQFIGLFSIIFFIRRIENKVQISETSFLRSLALSGYVHGNLNAFFSDEKKSHEIEVKKNKRVQLLRNKWKSWLESVPIYSDEDTATFYWGKEFQYSEEFATSLEVLMRKGVGLRRFFQVNSSNFDELFQYEINEAVEKLPIYFSLIMVACFGPAFFLVIIGVLCQYSEFHTI